MSLKLECRDVSLERGGRRLQSGLSFDVAAGNALLLTGPNGSGKTTLLRAIAGFVRPVKGQIALSGGFDAATLGERCHLIGHTNALKPGLTVAENAAFWADYLGPRGDGRPARLAAALDRFALTELAGIPAGYLSAGQKRRLGLARLLLAPRPLWLLDEPTVSLDAANAAVLRDLACDHLATGGIVVAATHLPLGLTPVTELALAAPGGSPETSELNDWEAELQRPDAAGSAGPS